MGYLRKNVPAHAAARQLAVRLVVSSLFISQISLAQPNSNTQGSLPSALPNFAPRLAQNLMVGSATQPSQSSRFKQPESSQSTLDELAFFMKFESYLNRERPPAGIPDYQQIGSHFKTESEGRYFKGTLELGGSFSTSVENYSNVYVPEAFLELKTANFEEAELSGDLHVRASLGRRLENWSLLDRNWDLGIWEPLNRFDALRPIDQGLTGAFVEGGAGELKFVAFLSGVYIPEQGANFSLQNGKLKSSNPWFSEPTDRLILFSETTQVQYDILTPSTGSVISQASGGILLRYGNLTDGFYSQISYAIKPRNQLSTPFEGSLNLTDTSSYAFVQIHPKVDYQQLFGGELGYNMVSQDGDRLFGAGLSLLSDFPVNQFPGANLTYQELAPMMFISPKVLLGFEALNSDFEFAVSYLHSEGGGFTMKGPFASDKAVFGSRVPVREALALDGRVVMGKGRQSTVTMGGRWLEELFENGSMLQADASLDFSMNGSTQDWRISVMGDVLGSRLPSNDNRGYVSRYRGHDRWMSQLRFLF
jgi:hypothetical protein